MLYVSNTPSIYSDAFPAQAILDFIAARDAVLGPRELRTDGLPYNDDEGNVLGGTALERTGRKGNARLAPVKADDGGRCYTIGPSFQFRPSYMSPCAGSKLEGGESDSSGIRRNILRVRFFYCHVSFPVMLKHVLCKFGVSQDFHGTCAGGG